MQGEEERPEEEGEEEEVACLGGHALREAAEDEGEEPVVKKVCV